MHHTEARPEEMIGLFLERVPSQGNAPVFNNVGVAEYASKIQCFHSSLFYPFLMAAGFSREDNASLFVAGFGSSALFGTFVGSLADKYGRRNFAAAGIAIFQEPSAAFLANFWGFDA